MRGVEPERRQRRGNVGVEMTSQLVPLPFRQLAPGREHDSVLPQCRKQFVRIARRLRSEHLQHCAPDRRQVLAGVSGAGSRIVLVRGLRLAPQYAHPLHEELVQIRREDGEKFHAFQKGGPWIPGLVQDASIELEPSQISVGPSVCQQFLA
jgi:hypothetical protein